MSYSLPSMWLLRCLAKASAADWKLPFFTLYEKTTPVLALSMTIMDASNLELPHRPPMRAIFAILVPVLSSLADEV